jgi:hypothetical protein
MSRKTVEFELAHKEFKTTQLSAFHSYEILFGGEEVEPEELLRDTYIKFNGDWIRLDSNKVIAQQVFHPMAIEAPLSALVRLMDKVKRISCDGMYKWEAIQVPKRFLSKAKTVESPRGMSMLSTLFTEKLATLYELQEVYSLDDALRMYDDFTVKSINSALHQEKAMDDAKSKR